jgi:hypothetical protein
VTLFSCWEQSIGWFRVNGASGHSIADLFARKLAYSDQESTENRLQGALSRSEKVQLPFPNEGEKIDRIYAG